MTNELRRRGAATKANVQITRGPRTISDDEEFLLQETGNVTSTQRFNDEGNTGEARIIHTAPGRVLMWKPGPDGRYTPRTVSESSKGINLQNGWKSKCPDCGTNHEASPYPPGDPNACPGREPVAWDECPVCGKRITDNRVVTNFEPNLDAPDAAMRVKGRAIKSTPESRLEMGLDEHMWVFHPRQARARGLTEVPVALRPVKNVEQPV